MVRGSWVNLFLSRSIFCPMSSSWDLCVAHRAYGGWSLVSSYGFFVGLF